jgi:hypothetical protein
MLNFFRKKPAPPERGVTNEREFLEIDATEHGIFTQLAPGTEFIGNMTVPEGVHFQGALVGNLRFGVSGRGHLSKDNRLTQAKFLCVDCGYENHADLVGAINILERGYRLLACGEMAQSGRSAKQQPTEATMREVAA